MGILQARIQEWVAMPFFRGSSRPRDPTQVSCTAGRYFIISLIREALSNYTNIGRCLVFLHISLCYLEIKALKIWWGSLSSVVRGKGGMGRWESTRYFGPFFSWWCDLGWRLPENVTELEGHFLLHTSAPKDKYLGHDEWCLNLACLTHKSIKAREWLQGPFRFLLHHQKVLIVFQKKKNLGEINLLWRVIFLIDVS